MKRELRTILTDAGRRGWQVERTERSHWKLRGPNNALIYTGGTPSDWRSIANLKAQIRRAERYAATAQPHRHQHAA